MTSPSWSAIITTAIRGNRTQKIIREDSLRREDRQRALRYYSRIALVDDIISQLHSTSTSYSKWPVSTKRTERRFLAFLHKISDTSLPERKIGSHSMMIVRIEDLESTVRHGVETQKIRRGDAGSTSVSRAFFQEASALKSKRRSKKPETTTQTGHPHTSHRELRCSFREFAQSVHCTLHSQ